MLVTTGDITKRLEHVFVNLFINARDAVEERWELHDDEKNAKDIRIVTHREDGTVAVEICDSGSGVPPSIAGKIFEPFFTTKNVGKGTGPKNPSAYGSYRKSIPTTYNRLPKKKPSGN